MNKLKKGLLFSILLSSTTYGYQEVYEFHNIRQKAMGGTHVSTAKNSTTFYQNPAYLQLEKKFKISIPKIAVGFNTDIINNLDDINTLSSSTEDISKQIEVLKSLVPLKGAFSGNIQPVLTFTKKGFGLTTTVESKVGFDLKQKTAPKLQAEGSINTNYQLGFGHTINYLDKEIHIGVSTKYISRAILYDAQNGNNIFELDQVEIIKAFNGLSEFEADSYTIKGFGVDLGTLYQYETKYGNAMAGITVKNILSSLSGSQNITTGNTTESYDVNTKDNLVVSIGNNIIYKIPYLGKLEIATDYNLIAPTQSFFKRIHLGAEKKVTPILSLRGGINQGFIVGGFGINLFLIKIDYAYFAEEFSGSLGKNVVESHNIQLGMLF